MKTFSLKHWSAAVVVGVSLVGCQPPPPTATPAEREMHDKATEAGNSIHDATEKSVDAVKAAGAVVEEKAQQGVEKTKEVYEDVKRDLDSPSK